MSRSPAPELLAPAGDRDCAFAAFAYGADAVYLGAQQFSARADAANFSPEQLDEVAAYAHSLTPARRVYLAVNTVVYDSEIPAVAALLDLAAQCRVDALIVQDAGVLRLARKVCPHMELHASTQLAIHNLPGAMAARAAGFQQVTLARELSLDEIRAISRRAGIRTEVFIHGALCYSYSGLCLYSSLLRERSGNRGACAYPCREFFAADDAGGKGGLVFSMKDLALGSAIRNLAEAGVHSLKIEGRKKSALYVAAVTDLYRYLLDASEPDAELVARKEDAIRTIFSRPWTRLHLDGPVRAGVTDTAFTGHRGTPVGKASVVRRPDGVRVLAFTSTRALERHDGLQLDLPGTSKPYGFAVDQLLAARKRGQPTGPVFAVPAGTHVEVVLPVDAPRIPDGTVVYCASSQEVKRSYPFTPPKPGLHRNRIDVSAAIDIRPDRVHVDLHGPNGCRGVAQEGGAFDVAQKPDDVPDAVRRALDRLRDTPLHVTQVEVRNPDDCFVPASILNRLRRMAGAELTAALQDHRRRALQATLATEQAPAPPPDTPPGLHHILKVDDPSVARSILRAPGPLPDEVILELAPTANAPSREALPSDAPIRFALPAVARDREVRLLAKQVGELLRAGRLDWEIANLYGLNMLRQAAEETGVRLASISADWPLYTCNRCAARQWLALGLSRVALPPDLPAGDAQAVVAGGGVACVLPIRQDVPLFISENCAVASLNRTCPGATHCGPPMRPLHNARGEQLDLLTRHCRTFVLQHQPGWIPTDRIREAHAAGCRQFRTDLLYRAYTSEAAQTEWQTACTHLAVLR